MTKTSRRAGRLARGANDRGTLEEDESDNEKNNYRRRHCLRGFVCLWLLVLGNGAYKTMIWKHTRDDAAAGAALREYFPENGTYLVPGFANDDATMETLSKKGPVALVNMIAVEGAAPFDPMMLVKGFFLNLVVIILIALLLRRVVACLPSYMNRVMFVALAGLTATVLIEGGDIAWWHIS